MSEQHGFIIEIEVIEPGDYTTGLKSALRVADDIIHESGGEAAVVVRSTGHHLYRSTPASTAFCEGCEGHVIPGVRWPTAANSDETHQWVERCDTCDRYATDDEAAQRLVVEYAGSGAAYTTGRQLPVGSSALTPFFDLES